MSATASRGFIRIPESQLQRERRQKMTNRTWHQNIMNLLLGKNVCGSCLRVSDDLVNWDADFVFWRPDYDIQNSLKNIMISTFGPSVISIIPTRNFCQKCVDIILSAHMLILELRNNCNHIQKKLTEVSQQMKWTCYLDDTGSLTESINNKLNPDDWKSKTTSDNLPLAKTQSEVTEMSNSRDFIGEMEKDLKTHKIILNNESLKNRLLQEPDMHNFLILKDNNTPKKFIEHKLPAEITVKKVTNNIDMSDFAPHDLLELNWAEDENNLINTDTQILNNKLCSNEALIMNLMEEAKTVEKHIHFKENLKLQAIKHAQIPVAKQNINNSLTVKLLQTNKSHENDSDNDELVPQDLLELKWPEEQPSNTGHQTKIPVKKLNFNEALTVKFIPSHNACEVQDSVDIVDEMAPHELLELNWNETAETQNTNLPLKQADKNHIDLTQWLQDQGMNTIKAKANENKRTHNLNVGESHILKKNKSEVNKQKEILETINNNQQSVTSSPNMDLIKCNVILKNTEALKVFETYTIRCGLCESSFIQFESYRSHYKTHKITEAAKCYKCPAQFSVMEFLVEHLLLMHSEDMSYCTLCYALLKQDRLAKHMVDYHGQKVQIINAPNNSKIYCKKCNQLLIDTPNNPHVCEFKLDCIECKQNCVHEKYLLSYIEQIKANMDVFKCADCDYQYKTKQDIIRHANYAHLKHKSQQCKICSATFSLKVDLTNHNDKFHFRCRGCRKVFADKATLDSHSCPKAVGKDLICEFCGEIFMALKCYLQHKQTAVIVSDKCGFCSALIPNKCNMSRHMQNVHHVSLSSGHSSTIFECTICQTDYKTESDFKEHVCLYDCHVCLKRFTVKVLFEKHLQAHMETVTAMKCSVCSEQLVDRYALQHHMLSHTDYDQCAVCKDYIEVKLLAQHMESHVDQDRLKFLKCPHCALVCENQNQFEVHVNRFHLLSRPYQCDLCKKSFYSKHKLREHIKKHSSQARQEKCTICNKKFARKISLENHMRLHTVVGQLYDCDLCEKRYISLGLLNEHRKSHMAFGAVNVVQAETSQI